MALPLVLSVPHAGTSVPPEAEPYCVLTPAQIEADGDEGAAEIYALADEVEVHVTTEVARAIVDLNRAPDDFRPDGIIKTHTCWQEPVYAAFPPPDVVRALIDAYWRPYHRRLRQLGQSGRFLLGVDGHTMAATGPPTASDAGSTRPHACLSNDDRTCPTEWLVALQEALAPRLGGEVTVNTPFRGGYITRTCAEDMPWLQIELSRAPYMTNQQKRQAVLASLVELCRFIGKPEGE
ncbi:N-formylglutamate amidohydrolase [Candidatus Poriferisocius sp.]|uniref:N-formylglutamate amidohydrolase n=1 Tax=Candidatus Poriferisocius sp. TaxID=3101276 RepID=UPI003B5A3187